MSDLEFGVRITADNRVFIDGVQASSAEIKKLGEGLREVSKDAEKASSGMEGMTGAVVKGTIATDILNRTVDTLCDVYRKTVDLTRELQQDQARVEAVLMATGRTAEVSSERVTRFAESLAKATKFDDDDIRRANAQLLTFANLTQTQIERVLKSAADLSQLYGGDLASNAMLIAKAMTETGNTIGPLERKFGDLDAGVRKHITSLKEMGDVNAAGDAILAQVEQRVGGSAVNAYRGLERQVSGTKKAWDDFLKSLGSQVFDAQNREAGALEKGIDSMRESFERNMKLWDDFRARGWIRWFQELRLAMLGISLPDPVPGRSGPGFASGTIKKPDGSEGLSEEGRRQKADLTAANKIWDDILDKIDRSRQMEREIEQIRAVGLRTGKDELEIERAVGLVREKYTHDQRDAAREAARIAKERAAWEKQQAEQALKDDLDSAKARAKMDEEKRDAYDKLQEQFNAAQASLENIVEDSELELQLVGKTTTEAALLRREHELTQAIKQKMVGLDEWQQDTLKDQLATTIAILNANNAIAQAKRTSIAVAKEEAEAYASFIGAAMNFIVDFAQNGRSAIGRLRGDLGRLIADMFKLASTRWAMSLVGQVSGNAAMVQQASALGAGSSAGSALSLASSASSAIGLTGYASSAYSGIQAGYIAQTAYLSGSSEIAASSGTVWGSMGEGIATIAEAVPVWGWILLAILALVAIFSKPGGGAKEGGSFGGTFDSSGAFVGDATIPGTDNGRFFTPSSMDPAMRRAGTQIAGSYFDALTRLGGRSGGNVTFGLGIDTDPRGDAQSRWSSLVQVGGRTMYNVRDRSVGRDEGDMEKEFADQIPRMILAALQGSDWSDIKGVGQILSTVNAETATQEAIKAVIDLADAFSVMRNAMADIDLGKFIGELQKGPNDRFRDMGKALTELSGKTKVTVADMQRLGQSTMEYKNAVAQLLAGFESAKVEIDGMFADTMRSIRMNNMTDEQRYAFLQGESDDLLSQIQGSTNADEIRNLASRINEDINQAFAMLSPEEQRAREQDYLTRIERANQITRERLADVQRETASEANRILQQIKDAMDLKAEQFKEAADIQLEAANINRSNPIQVEVDVEVFDSRATASVVNGG